MTVPPAYVVIIHSAHYDCFQNHAKKSWGRYQWNGCHILMLILYTRSADTPEPPGLCDALCLIDALVIKLKTHRPCNTNTRHPLQCCFHGERCIYRRRCATIKPRSSGRIKCAVPVGTAPVHADRVLKC